MRAPRVILLFSLLLPSPSLSILTPPPTRWPTPPLLPRRRQLLLPLPASLPSPTGDGGAYMVGSGGALAARPAALRPAPSPAPFPPHTGRQEDADAPSSPTCRRLPRVRQEQQHGGSSRRLSSAASGAGGQRDLGRASHGGAPSLRGGVRGGGGGGPPHPMVPLHGEGQRRAWRSAGGEA
jgi:hypothetical protein